MTPDTLRITVIGRDFEFPLQQGPYGVRVGTSVKCHHSITLSSRGDKKEKGLRKYIGSIALEKLRENVVEQYRASWWERMTTRANVMRLGPILSHGRSGGYLILSKWDREQIFACRDAIEAQCYHCGDPYENHIESKCPFDAQAYKPAHPYDWDKLIGLEAFIAEVRQSVQEGPAFLDAEYYDALLENRQRIFDIVSKARPVAKALRKLKTFDAESVDAIQSWLRTFTPKNAEVTRQILSSMGIFNEE